jgi:DNA-binding NtrC family response regulator
VWKASADLTGRTLLAIAPSDTKLHVPVLRERPQDIPFIAQQALDKAKAAFVQPVKGFTQETMDCAAYRWLGNVRELRLSRVGLLRAKLTR